jgi:hypothetical protein
MSMCCTTNKNGNDSEQKINMVKISHLDTITQKGHGKHKMEN